MIETHRAAGPAVRAAALGAMLAGAALAGASSAPAAATEAEWPCAQRYVPEISAGAIWTGPSLEAASGSWQENEAVQALIDRLAEYDVDAEQGAAAIDEFTATLGPDRDMVLTQLFAGLLDRFNRLRARMLKGTKNFFRRQQKIVGKITDLEVEIRSLDEEGGSTDDEKRQGLDTELTWNVRVFEEREKLTPYICEEPVLLEQKLGVLARAIESHVGK